MRVAAHSAVGVIDLMPIADPTHFAFKYVNGHSGNHGHSTRVGRHSSGPVSMRSRQVRRPTGQEINRQSP